MQPINLLPPYIFDKEKKFALVGLWAVIVAICVIGPVVYATSVIGPKLDQAKQDKETADKFASSWKNSDAKIQAAKAAVADIKSKQDFIQNAKTWNAAWPAMFEMVRDWTNQDILLKSLSLDSAMYKTLNIAGFAQSEDKVIRWWMALRNNPQFERVTFSLPPHDYAPTGAQGAAGGLGGFGGRGGFGAPSGMMPGMGSMGRFGGGVGGSRRSEMGGPMGMSGAGGRMAMAGIMGGGAPGMGGFGGGAGTAANGNVGPSEVEGKPGIDFVATAVLKEPLAKGMPVPSWPPTAADTTGGFGGGMGGLGSMGRFGGMGGAPGMGGPMGMPGGPGMMRPGAPGMGGGAAAAPGGAAARAGDNDH